MFIYFQDADGSNASRVFLMKTLGLVEFGKAVLDLSSSTECGIEENDRISTRG